MALVLYICLKALGRSLKFTFKVVKRSKFWCAAGVVLVLAELMMPGRPSLVLSSLLIVAAAAVLLFGLSGAVSTVRSDQRKKLLQQPPV